MKVLVVTFEYPPFAGGIATYALTLAESLVARDCRVRVLAPWYPGSEALDATLASETVRMGVGHGTMELVRFAPGLFHLVRQIRAFAPDGVLLASDLAHGIGAVACAVLGVSFVPVVHGSEVAKHFPPRTAKQRLQGVALGYAYRRADRVVCVSGYVKDLMVAAGFAAERIQVIHNGIDAALLDAPRDPVREAALRARYGVGKGPVLLTFARLTPRKGQDTVFRALPGLRTRFPGLRYLVAGKGDDGGRLQALAATLGVEDAVVFAGEVPEEDKVALLDVCDAYVLASREEGQRVEGLGIALLEAAARGKALVAGRHGGVPEVVEDGVNGFLVDPLDPEDVGRRLAQVLADPEAARRMGEAGRERVRTRFLAGVMASAYRDLFGELAGTR